MFVSLGPWLGSERRCRPTVSAQFSGLSSPGLRPGRGHCVVFLGQTQVFLITMKFLGAFRKLNALTILHK